MQSPPRPVLDTNVFVSGATIAEDKPLSPSQQIITAWRAGTVDIATSPPILAELRRVLFYDRVRAFTKMSNPEIERYVNELEGSAIVVPGRTPVQVSDDPDDNKLFACALEAQADYLVSGDKDHVLSVGTYEGIQTISPRDFVDTVLEPPKKAA